MKISKLVPLIVCSSDITYDSNGLLLVLLVS